jgi:hypothetical protein
MKFKFWLNEMNNETIHSIVTNLNSWGQSNHNIMDVSIWSILHDAVEEAGYPTNINQLHKDITNFFIVPVDPNNLYQRSKDANSLVQIITNVEPHFLINDLFRPLCSSLLFHGLYGSKNILMQLEDLEEHTADPIRQNAVAIHHLLQTMSTTIEIEHHDVLQRVQRFVNFLASYLHQPSIIFNLYGMDKIVKAVATK